MKYWDFFAAVESSINSFIFNSLKIENYTPESHSQYRYWYQHFRDNHLFVDGDIFEFGVYRGASLISMALLAKSMNSKKHIYGFDSFTGFPENCYSPKDNLTNFTDQNHFDSSISKLTDIYNSIRGIESESKVLSNLPNTLNKIGKSGVFAENSIDIIQFMIHEFELDNVTILEGNFDSTIPEFFTKHSDKPVFSVNIDCDLYDSYSIVLANIAARLQPGGYIHLDEYFSLKYPGARIAVNEFLQSSQGSGFNLLQKKSFPGEFPRFALVLK